MRADLSAGLGLVLACAVLPTQLYAQTVVRDATYRGTLVCGKLPFATDPVRAAIEVKIAGGKIDYSHPVLLSRATVAGTETGTGTLDGAKIALKGGWKGDRASYDASYSGTFVRRSARLTGKQIWTREGKTYERTCTGAIKRPLAAFLPRAKKKEQ